MAAPGTATKVVGTFGGVVLAIAVAFFVWLAKLDTRITVIEETRRSEKTSELRVEEANTRSFDRIEHEREANDARVRDDLREIRSKVFK
jgi:hypothetical protein